MARFRAQKKELEALLEGDDWRERLDERMDALAREREGGPATLANPLLALRLAKAERTAWRAAEALGRVTARTADVSMEKARVLMRTYMWYLNEESGNLGWGIPEAMAAAMADNDRLAREYHTILASYVYCEEGCDGNYLDHPELRRGVFWGLGRLARARPELVEHAQRFLVQGCKDHDAVNRGLAARVLGILASSGRCTGPAARTALRAISGDSSEIRVYEDGFLRDATVGELAAEALAQMA
ncbi:MAG: DVU0298 family protein [Desulfovibrionaceae bacterium]